MFSRDHLIRTEVSTLIGLMIQGETDWTIPPPHVIQEQMDRTNALLKEFHETFLSSMSDAIVEFGTAAMVYEYSESDLSHFPDGRGYIWPLSLEHTEPRPSGRGPANVY